MRRFHRWLMICGGLGLLGLGLVVWVAHSRATETLEESERIADRMIAEQRAKGSARPPLGAPVPGSDARAIYAAVMPDFGGLSADEDYVLLQLEGRYGNSPAQVPATEARALLEKTRPLLERLRPILTAPTVSQIHVNGHWPAPDVEQVEHWQVFDRVVSAHVQEHVRAGRIDEALDLCVLRWFAALDFARHGSILAHLVGTGLAEASATDIRRILADCDVGAARLAQLAGELDFLRAATPALHDAWRIEEIYLRRLIVRDADGDSELTGGSDLMAGLRFLFSGRLVCANALERFAPIRAALFAAVEGKPAGEAEAAARAVVQQINDDPNLLLRVIFVVFPSTVVQDAETRTLLELLRVTVALARHRKAHGRLPEKLEALVPALLDEIPACPCSGTPLRYDGERLWSIGADGIDDGGSTPLAYDQGVTEDGDVVFTLRTRRLQRFPWHEDVPPETRAHVEQAIAALHRGGREAREAQAVLVAHESEICGRLISEFAALEEKPGLDTAEGRAQASAIDETLRKIDGFMEHRWLERKTIRVDSDAAFARLIAARWTNWWYRRQWETDPLEPFEPDEGAAEGGGADEGD